MQENSLCALLVELKRRGEDLKKINHIDLLKKEIMPFAKITVEVDPNLVLEVLKVRFPAPVMFR